MNTLLNTSTEEVQQDLSIIESEMDACMSEGTSLDIAIDIAERIKESVESFGMSQELIAFVGNDYDDLVSGKAFADLTAEEATEGVIETIRAAAVAVWDFIVKILKKIWGFFTWEYKFVNKQVNNLRWKIERSMTLRKKKKRNL